MTASALISESDWLRLRAALRHMDEISLERSLGAVRVRDESWSIAQAMAEQWGGLEVE